MKNLFVLILTIIATGFACQSKSSESTVHRRNFSKNVFEEEFASIEIACDNDKQSVLLKNTKWLKIDDAHLNPIGDGEYLFEKNKKLRILERNFEHDLYLEKVENDAFMFRYTGIQNVIDTVEAVNITNQSIDKSNIDSTRLFSIESRKYYEVRPEDAPSKPSSEVGFQLLEEKVETLYRNNRTVDKGRVVCKCDRTVKL